MPIILFSAPSEYIISIAAESKAIILLGDFSNVIFFLLVPVIINGYIVAGDILLSYVIFFFILFVAGIGCFGLMKFNSFTSLLAEGLLGVKVGFILYMLSAGGIGFS